MRGYHIVLFSVVVFLGFSCKKDNTPANVQKNLPESTTSENVLPLTIQFKNVFGSQEFFLGTSYAVAGGDSIRINKFKYYISNIVLIKSDNSVYKVPNSYYLLDQAQPQGFALSLPGLPAGEYKGLKLMLGVDSMRNTSGAQAGALDPANGMFWSWNSGYIMMKLEGTSSASSAPDKSVIYHLGGFSGANKVQREFDFTFNNSVARVNANSSSTINLETNIAELFVSPNTISFSSHYYIMQPGPNAALIAGNYADMITYKTIE